MKASGHDSPSPFTKVSTIGILTNVTIVGFLLAVTFTLYGQHLNDWWWNDDATILMHAISHPRASYFYDPEHWRDLVVSSFTPWVSAMFALDHAISPWNPKFQYLHHLLVIYLISILLWMWVRSKAGNLLGFAIAFTFLWGAPVAVVAQQLMTRHYAEGLLYLLLHYLLVNRACQTEGKRAYLWSFGAMIAGFIAMLSKEVYVPLLLLSAVWMDRQKLRLLVPTVLGIASYAVLRTYMLGSAVGGYQDNSKLFESVTASLSRFTNIPENLWQPAPIALSIWLIALSLYVIKHIKSHQQSKVHEALRLSGKGFFFIALLVGPLWPLTTVTTFTINDQRFYFAIWGMCLAMLGFVLTRVSRPIGLVIISTLFWLSLGPRERASKNLEPVSAEFFEHGKAILNEQQGRIIWLSPLVANWYSSSIREMREQTMTLKPGHSHKDVWMVSDWLELTGVDLSKRELLRYDTVSQNMEVVASEKVNEAWKTWSMAMQRSEAHVIEVRMLYDFESRTLNWQFTLKSPNSVVMESKVTAVLFEGGVFPMPDRGSFRTGDITSGCLVLKFESKSQDSLPVVAYSPLFRFSQSTSDGAQGRVARIDYSGPTQIHTVKPACSNRRAKDSIY